MKIRIILEVILSFSIGLLFLYCFYRRIEKIHRITEMKYVNLNRLFSINDSLKHDSSISHIFMSTFVCMRSNYFL